MNRFMHLALPVLYGVCLQSLISFMLVDSVQRASSLYLWHLLRRAITHVCPTSIQRVHNSFLFIIFTLYNVPKRDSNHRCRVTPLMKRAPYNQATTAGFETGCQPVLFYFNYSPKFEQDTSVLRKLYF